MTLTAFILISFSALLHATWNVLGKQESPTIAFFLVANIAGVLLLSPTILLYGEAIPFFSWRVWQLLGLTGGFQAIYCAGLATAYRTGEMSIAYPLVRSFPVIVTTVVVLLLGRGNQLTWLSILGSFLVVVGCFFIPMRHFKDFRLSNYLCLSCGMALIAALGTTGYSIIDDEALRALRNSPDIVLQSYEISLLYGFLSSLSTVTFLSILTLIPSVERINLRITIKNRIKMAGLVGVFMYTSYPLVLVSMAFASNISYVVAFRQISVPLGALMGMFLLGEAKHIPKFVGMGVIFIGLVMVGLG